MIPSRPYSVYPWAAGTASRTKAIQTSLEVVVMLAPPSVSPEPRPSSTPPPGWIRMTRLWARGSAAKLELYSAMRAQGVSKRTLARRLGLSDTTVGRLTNPGSNSRIGHLVRALRAVGRGLVIEGRVV